MASTPSYTLFRDAAFESFRAKVQVLRWFARNETLWQRDARLKDIEGVFSSLKRALRVEGAAFKGFTKDALDHIGESASKLAGIWNAFEMKSHMHEYVEDDNKQHIVRDKFLLNNILVEQHKLMAKLEKCFNIKTGEETNWKKPPQILADLINSIMKEAEALYVIGVLEEKHLDKVYALIDKIGPIPGHLLEDPLRNIGGRKAYKSPKHKSILNEQREATAKEIASLEEDVVFEPPIPIVPLVADTSNEWDEGDFEFEAPTRKPSSRGNTITLTILDANGRPLPKAKVNILNKKQPAQGAQNLRTNSKGIVRFTGFALGTGFHVTISNSPTYNRQVIFLKVMNKKAQHTKATIQLVQRGASQAAAARSAKKQEPSARSTPSRPATTSGTAQRKRAPSSGNLPVYSEASEDIQKARLIADAFFENDTVRKNAVSTFQKMEKQSKNNAPLYQIMIKTIQFIDKDMKSNKERAIRKIAYVLQRSNEQGNLPLDKHKKHFMESLGELHIIRGGVERLEEDHIDYWRWFMKLPKNKDKHRKRLELFNFNPLIKVFEASLEHEPV